jgi:hypothetical protein
MSARRSLCLAILVPLLLAPAVHAQVPAAAAKPWRDTTIQVSGSGMDQLTSAVVHFKDSTAAELRERSTEIVQLEGDLQGRVLYSVTTVISFVHGTLVNTGDEVYSGTVAGSAPVVLHDDQFRFDANLVTGAETGKVYLVDHVAGPQVQCWLDVIGTGVTAEGNPKFNYSGRCTFGHG